MPVDCAMHLGECAFHIIKVLEQGLAWHEESAGKFVGFLLGAVFHALMLVEPIVKVACFRDVLFFE